jgi:SAM-dependent methyltransferase
MLIRLDYRNEAVLREIERLWNAASPSWRWWPRNPYQAEYSWAFDVLEAALGGSRLAGLKVMDAGGGCGAFQHVLARAGADVLNVDVEAKAHVSGAGAPTRQLSADLEQTGLEVGSFDGIVSVSSVEHNAWEKLVRVVRHLLSLLKPGGPLVLTFPMAETRRWVPDGGWTGPGQQGWPRCYLFDQDAVKELAEKVIDLAEPCWSPLPPLLDYRSEWQRMHLDMVQNSPPQSVYPYLSGGLVLRRNP